MATPLEAHSIIQVRIVGQYLGQQVITVLNYVWDSGAESPDYRQVMNDVWDKINQANGLWAKYRAAVNTGYTLSYVALQPVHPTRLAQVQKTPADLHGTQPGTKMPPNSAAVLTKRADVATRSGIGAVHIPATTQENFDPLTGEWGLPFQDDLGNVLTKVIEEHTLPDFVKLKPVLWSPADEDEWNQVTGGTVQPAPRVMRRRTKGVGR